MTSTTNINGDILQDLKYRPKPLFFSKWEKRGWLVILALLFLASCHPNSRLLEPKICLPPQARQVDCLPSSFPPLTSQELATEWGKELQIAQAFGREFDLYRAITAYKRALILISFQSIERRLQIEFCLIQCYYLGEKYQEAIDVFEKSALTSVPRSFPPFEELLLMVEDSYKKIGQGEKAERVLKVIESAYPPSAEKIQLGEAYLQGDLPSLAALNQNDFLSSYHQRAKSVKQAQLLNAVLPGAGYYYVGQKKAALTSFVINSLFIAAAYYFFDHHNIPAGLITTSLEMGWYLGGINGAGLAAKEYNERLYENSAKEVLFKNRLIPVLMFETCF